LPDLGLEKEAKVHGCQSELGEGASEAKRWAKTNSKQKKIVGWFWFCEKRENNVATNRRLECQFEIKKLNAEEKIKKSE
jgi:hypothetical protein